MKKIILYIFASILMLLPIDGYAETQALDLTDTLEVAEIEPKFDNYEESDEQTTIYIFWWTQCSVCHNLLNWINGITSEYGEMFKVRSFEVTNSDNDKLKTRIIDYFDLEAPGVPLIIVGENTFYGFSESTEDKILTAIKNEYESEEKFDIIEKLDEKDSQKNPNDALFILIPIAGIALILFLIKLAKKE